MDWKEFVTDWANQKHQIESLPLSNSLTEKELNDVLLKMFPDVGTELQDKAVYTENFIPKSTFRKRCAAIYEKCGLGGNGSKRKLHNRLAAEYNKLTQSSTSTPSTNLNSIASPPVNSPSSQIDWLAISQQLLTQQQNLTTNPLQLGATRNLDDVHVPLSLMERKERKERKEHPQVKQERSSEMGSQLSQPNEIPETRLEHEEFLTEVVGKRTVNNKHIAIIGEPGAGKTTLLTKIGEWLIDRELQKDNPESSIVVWVSLASLESQDLSDYLYGVWLKNAHPAARPPDSWVSELENLITNKRVWLLLDGLDETSRSDAPSWLNRQLSGWGQNLRVVVTCRLNHWDGVSNSLVNSFEVYLTGEYEYRTATGEDRILEFLTKWFGNPDTARQIRTSLDDSGKERIKDLVKNPLRLTLLCASWEENKALPDTQAELYLQFVNYLYRWKAQEFQAEVDLRKQLNPALGELATAGLNRQPNRDGVVRRFRFTEWDIAESPEGLSPTLLSAAKRLGWLNVVGTEAGENIYAFLHSTFQEYFAACIIDDWDYFLPRAHVDRPVPCQGETEPTYRVFEKEWQQPILLWIGRENVDDELKEEFIKKLTDFKELKGKFYHYRTSYPLAHLSCNPWAVIQAVNGANYRTSYPLAHLSCLSRLEGEFYYYRAYCIAGICVGEFQSSRQAKNIVKQIITWAFGYLDDDREEWVTFWPSIQSLAVKIIPLIHGEFAIAALVRLLDREDSDNSPRVDVARALGEIGIGHPAIEALVQEDSDNSLRVDVARALGEIGIGQPPAIEALVRLLGREDLEASVSLAVAIALCKIGIGNPTEIAALVGFLERMRLGKYRHMGVARALCKIGIVNSAVFATLLELPEDLGDPLWLAVAIALCKIGSVNSSAVFATLVEFLEQKDWDNSLRVNVARALGEIDVGNPEAIATLVEFLEQKDWDNSLRVDVARALGQIAVGNPEAIAALVEFLEQKDWDNSLRVDVARALGQIAVGNPEAIATLVEFLKQKGLDNSLHMHVTEVLGQIAVGNQKAIATLVEFLKQKGLDNSLYMHVTEALGRIAVGNQKAIEALVEFLKQKGLDNSLYMHVTEALGRIAVGNQKAIEALVEFLKQKDWDNSLHMHVTEVYSLQMHVTEVLGRIAVGNQKAIAALVRLLEQEDGNYYIWILVVETLIAILTKPIMPSVVAQLSNHFTTNVDKSKWEKFHYCQDLIFHCCQTLSYPTIHAAWYQNHLPTIPFSLPTLQSQLNHPNTILLDITTLNSHTPNDIPQALTNLIYNQLETRPIPTVTNILQLQTHILNQNLNPHFVLILYHPTPTPTLRQEITKLQIPQRIQIVWLANASIPDALPPEQPNLAAAIQGAITRFSSMK